MMILYNYVHVDSSDLDYYTSNYRGAFIFRVKLVRVTLHKSWILSDAAIKISKFAFSILVYFLLSSNTFIRNLFSDTLSVFFPSSLQIRNNHENPQ